MQSVPIHRSEPRRPPNENLPMEFASGIGSGFRSRGEIDSVQYFSLADSPCSFLLGTTNRKTSAPAYRSDYDR